MFKGELSGRPLIAMVDVSYRIFPNKMEAPWFLSVSIPLQQPDHNGLATNTEAQALNQLEDSIEKLLAGTCTFHFIGRVTWNGYRELLYYLDSPEKAAQALQDLIEAKKTTPFAFRCVKDSDWSRASIYWNT